MSSESVQPDIDRRTLRAATEYMTVIEEARGLFGVVSESGNTYQVDLAEPTCTCPDFQYREDIPECKHIRRVRLEVGQVDIHELEAQLASTADNLEANAEQLEAKAQDLTETATELRDALNRLEEVA